MPILILSVTTASQVMKSLLFSLSNKSGHHIKSLEEYGHATFAGQLLLGHTPLFGKLL